ncbi:MAG TPA: ABC transporter substrate-binding protein, partial [Longimicrobiaceae bacterium]|nr:ABC transporter substrate-binding protein [Longimicrobiaceae bacterium]
FTVAVRMRRIGPYDVNALLEVVPAPKHLLQDVAPERMRFAPFSRSPVGNGLFRFGSWQAGQNLTLEANPEVPEGRPALDRVVMRFVPDLNAAMTELLAGQGDMLQKLPPDQRQRVAAAPNVELHTAPRVRPAWIAWNTDLEPVNDPRVRRAILMGIDREQIARGLFGEVGAPALSPIPSRLWEHSAGVQPIPYDPAAARRLLQDAGWVDRDGGSVREKNGRPLRVEVDYNVAEQTRGDVLVAIQAMLRDIGVQLVPRAYERTTWVERLRSRQFQGSLWGWGWGPGVMGPNAAMVFHSRSIPPNGPNFAGYSNPRVDSLIDVALVTRDTAQARRIWAALEQQLIDDAVYAPLYMDPELYGVHERFRNVKFRGIEWWEDVPYWHIPPDRRLPRDRAR